MREIFFITPEKQEVAATGRRVRSGVHLGKCNFGVSTTGLGLGHSSRMISPPFSSAFLSKVGVTNNVYFS